MSMKISQVEKEFGSYYTAQMLREHKDKQPPRPDALRVSSFPYCGLRHAYRKMMKHTEDKPVGFGSQFYTGVGTITHEVVQEWLGHGGRIYGIWNCTRPGCGGRRDFSKNNVCPKCSDTMAYEEFTLKAFNNVSGHVDGVYRASDGTWWIVDYKTCSVKVIGDQKYNRTLPYKYNVAQIAAYAALIELQYDIKISGWLLHYLARDDPARTHITLGAFTSTKYKAQMLAKIETWDRHYALVTKPDFNFKTMLKLVEEKPCTSSAVYDREYSAFEPCPLSRGGVCFNATKLPEYLRLTWDEMRPRREALKVLGLPPP